MHGAMNEDSWNTVVSGLTDHVVDHVVVVIFCETEVVDDDVVTV